MFGALVIGVQQASAFDCMIWGLVEYTVFESLTQNAQDFVVDHLVTLKLLVGFEFADGIVCVTLVDGRHSTQLLVVPWVMRLVRCYDTFYK